MPDPVPLPLRGAPHTDRERPAGEQPYEPGVGEDDIALRFVEMHGKNYYRHVPGWGWMRWHGTHWARDLRLQHYDDVRSLCRVIGNDRYCAKLDSKRLARAQTVAAVVQLARADQRIVVLPQEFDADRSALNTPAGVVNLRDAMRPGPRALVAFVAGSIVSGKSASSIYDHAEGGYRLVSGSVSPKRVNVYDYTDSCHFSGSGTGSQLSLYHYGEGAHVTLDVKGKKFSGFDYGTGNHFSGHVTGRSVTLYDYGEGKYFNYSL